jgi:arabinofuranosyltransferase
MTRWAIILIPVVIVVAGGWAHRWVSEDAFIDFRVVHNLLAGHGPVFNVGERVEVYTDPLWVFILAIVTGIAPFIPIEWWSLLLGLAFAAGGFTFGGLSAMRLAERRGSTIGLPLGMLTMSVVAGVWDFTTSGLETGLVIGWMGLSFWLLIRTADSGRGATATAFVAGLGFLIRPDLLLIALAFLAGLACIIAKSKESALGWKRRWLVPALAAVVAHGVFRPARAEYRAGEIRLVHLVVSRVDLSGQLRRALLALGALGSPRRVLSPASVRVVAWG